MDTSQLLASKEFWTAVTTGVLSLVAALLGVWLANRSSLKLIRTQLEHDARERAREREMVMKRDVYLPAAVSVSKLQSLLAQVTNLNANDADLNRELIEHVAVIGQVQVVGTDLTVQAIIPLMAEYAAVVSDLAGKRAHLMVLKNLVDGLPEADKSPDGPFREWHSYIQQFGAQEIELSKSLIAGIESVSNKLPPALFAIREELGLPLDRQAYLSMIQDTRRRQVEILESRIRDIEKQMAED